MNHSQTPIESQFSQIFSVANSVRGELLAGSEDPECNGKVITPTLLREISWS
jgi:hypothetical protein